jgi:hypothetical protein
MLLLQHRLCCHCNIEDLFVTLCRHERVCRSFPDAREVAAGSVTQQFHNLFGGSRPADGPDRGGTLLSFGAEHVPHHGCQISQGLRTIARIT